MERKSGILLHITSLPSRYGVGTLGREAYAFADFLARAKQTYWQMLPLGPTGYGDSPYQSASAFAGNPYLIDLEQLIADGLLLPSEVEGVDWGGDPAHVDFEKLFLHRLDVLRLAWARGRERDAGAVAAFCEENREWIGEYALFCALKQHFAFRPWSEWDEQIRFRRQDALARYRALLADEIAFHTYVQFLFARQWRALSDYIHGKGIRIIGDLPIYVPYDSADVWQQPELFLLDEALSPRVVAGVPPDYFSATGQLWGNPIYDWARMANDGYAWWVARIGAAAQKFDVLRIDHFRGLDSYWAVPFGETTAVVGEWRKGPGMALIRAIHAAYPALQVIAEDLGVAAQSVDELLRDSGYPGMKVLEFAFDDSWSSTHLPHRYPRNCVAYTSTHDNTPVMGWVAEAGAHEVGLAVDYLGLSEAEGLHLGFIRGTLSSVADTAVIPMQDWLGLGAEARMNTPSTLGGNWTFRLRPGQLHSALADRIACCTRMYGRA